MKGRQQGMEDWNLHCHTGLDSLTRTASQASWLLHLIIKNCKQYVKDMINWKITFYLLGEKFLFHQNSRWQYVIEEYKIAFR